MMPPALPKPNSPTPSLSEVPKHLEPYVNLLHLEPDVLTLLDVPKAQLHLSFGGLKKDLLAIHGHKRERVLANFREAAQWSNAQRLSVASSTTALSSTSAWTASRPNSLASLLTHYSNDSSARITKRYYCPSCPKHFGRADDLLRHLRHICEKTNFTRYRCRHCNVVEIDPTKMEAHFSKSVQLDQQHPRRPERFEMPAKRTLGCTHCEFVMHIASADQYPQCLQLYTGHLVGHYNIDAKTDGGSPSQRVRALLGVESTRTLMETECMLSGLPLDAWLKFEWTTKHAIEIYNRLEYGEFTHDDPNVEHGYRDTGTFLASVIDMAIKPSTPIPQDNDPDQIPKNLADWFASGAADVDFMNPWLHHTSNSPSEILPWAQPGSESYDTFQTTLQPAATSSLNARKHPLSPTSSKHPISARRARRPEPDRSRATSLDDKPLPPLPWEGDPNSHLEAEVGCILIANTEWMPNPVVANDAVESWLDFT